jgi:hypothetical protein
MFPLKTKIKSTISNWLDLIIKGFGFGFCFGLTPPSAIFQLYHSEQF